MIQRNHIKEPACHKRVISQILIYLFCRKLLLIRSALTLLKVEESINTTPNNLKRKLRVYNRKLRVLFSETIDYI